MGNSQSVFHILLVIFGLFWKIEKQDKNGTLVDGNDTVEVLYRLFSYLSEKSRFSLDYYLIFLHSPAQ
jgi:hypothetical protein